MKDERGDEVLTPQLLLHAYSIGIFPMAEHRNDPEIFWVDPKRRGVFPLHRFHISRSLRRHMRHPSLRMTLDTCFDDVVVRCADRSDTWINAEISSLYSALHSMGHAHSAELWNGDELAGGVYGVALGGAFFGESMFSSQTNGSKTALACLIQHLQLCGFTLFDTQFVTPHLLSLGAEEISRATYHQRLEHALKQPARITLVPMAQPQDVVQRMTQRS